MLNAQQVFLHCKDLPKNGILYFKETFYYLNPVQTDGMKLGNLALQDYFIQF